MPRYGPWQSGLTDVLTEPVFGVYGGPTVRVNPPSDAYGDTGWSSLPATHAETTSGLNSTNSLGMGPYGVIEVGSGCPECSTPVSPAAQRKVGAFLFRTTPTLDPTGVTPPGMPSSAVGWEWESDTFPVEARIEASRLFASFGVRNDDPFGGGPPDMSGVSRTVTALAVALNPSAWTVSGDGTEITWAEFGADTIAAGTLIGSYTADLTTDVTGGDAAEFSLDYAYPADGPTWFGIAVVPDVWMWDEDPSTDVFPGTPFIETQVFTSASLLESGDAYGSGSKVRLYYSTPRYRWIYEGSPPLLARSTAGGVAPLLARSRTGRQEKLLARGPY